MCDDGTPSDSRLWLTLLETQRMLAFLFGGHGQCRGERSSERRGAVDGLACASEVVTRVARHVEWRRVTRHARALSVDPSLELLTSTRCHARVRARGRGHGTRVAACLVSQAVSVRVPT